ncbi:helix-turn-helix domain-containing protein, partial [Candidatus Peregrinibacteria bacterium]|nr:helix-turn-helix domain-containing protein [Candidatus Peregrinibacteria bacterium]
MQLHDSSDGRREEIGHFLRNAEALSIGRAARQRLRWFLYALDHGNDPREVGKHFGISPSTFRRWLKRFDPADPQSLEEKSRRPHTIREPDTLPEVVALIREYRMRFPTMGKEHIQEALAKEHGITLSPSTIGRVIRRERFFFANTLSHLHKRGPETPPKPSAATGAGSTIIGLLLFAVTAATFLLWTPQADAAVSTSFQLFSAFPNEATETPAASTNFQLNEGGITWHSTPLVGSNFQIVAAPPASSSSSAASSSSETPLPENRGGRRLPIIPPPRKAAPPLPGAKPAAPAAPEEEVPAPVIPPPGEAASSVPARYPPTPIRYRSPLLPVVVPPPMPEKIRETLPELRSASSAATAPVKLPPRRGKEPPWPVCPAERAGGLALDLLLFLLGLACGICIATGTGKPKKSGKAGGGRKRKRVLWNLILLATVAATFLLAGRAIAATTAPNTHVYNGHLLNSSGNAITTSHKIRFSYWKSADYVSTDTTSTGAINAGATNYASWNEVHTVTPDSQGYFSVRLGSGTSLPSLANYTAAELQSLYLQIEVKSASAADTSYELLDVDANNAAADRSPILSVPFALNADRVDQRDVGTGSGSIPFLQTGGLLPVSVIPDGTNQNVFVIDKDATSSTDITLTFGGTIAKRLWYDAATTRFNFDDDLHTTGNFTASGTFKVTGTATFGSTVRVNTVTYTFPYSDGASSGKVLKTSGAGQLSWSDDTAVGTGLAYGDAKSYFVDDGGDSMTGALLIQTKANGSAATADAGLQLEVVGTASGDHLHAQSLLTTSGTLTVVGAATFKSTLKLNGVTYTFPTSDGAQSGKILKTNGAGQLTFGNAGRSSGSILGLRPDYPNVAYFGSGAASVGTLSLRYSSGSEVTNHYRWQTTRTSNQHQWISTQIRLPDTFSTWEASKPLELRYRTNSGYITAYML